jgi:hypothetical protein
MPPAVLAFRALTALRLPRMGRNSGRGRAARTCFFRSAAFPCPSGTCRGPKKQVRATPAEFQGLTRRVSAECPPALGGSIVGRNFSVALRRINNLREVSGEQPRRISPWSVLPASGMHVIWRTDSIMQTSQFRIHAFHALSPFLSITHRENTITRLFSSTHPEQFFCPFVFNNSSRGLFIFNIFCCWVISRPGS